MAHFFHKSDEPPIRSLESLLRGHASPWLHELILKKGILFFGKEASEHVFTLGWGVNLVHLLPYLGGVLSMFS